MIRPTWSESCVTAARSAPRSGRRHRRAAIETGLSGTTGELVEVLEKGRFQGLQRVGPPRQAHIPGTADRGQRRNSTPSSALCRRRSALLLGGGRIAVMSQHPGRLITKQVLQAGDQQCTAWHADGDPRMLPYRLRPGYPRWRTPSETGNLGPLPCGSGRRTYPPRGRWTGPMTQSAVKLDHPGATS